MTEKVFLNQIGASIFFSNEEEQIANFDANPNTWTEIFAYIGAAD